ncbi:MAG TPA: NAD(P)H-quinone oxidoreductase [Acidimicrobiales bacterium]|nr:NAD(P)H-quinone oxidoreductase [Acidimicrobiales bacterium]
MRAIVLTEKGGPEVLRVQEVPEPVPGPDEVVVDVAATALNRADVLQRLGLYPQPGPAPAFEIPGLEVAGRVVERGERARAWAVGDEVMGIVSGGGYAERIAVHERQLVAVPSSVGLPDAAAIPEVFLTAWDALVVQGGLTSGRWALVHAGGSGVGTAAIQVAKAIGAFVATTASAGKLGALRDLGADRVIDRAGQWDLSDEIDVVLDVVGGDYLDRNLAALRTRGTIVQVGTMAGPPPSINLGLLMMKRAALIGTVLRARPVEEKLALTQRFGREIVPLFDPSGAGVREGAPVLEPVIDSRYPLADAADAHRRLESNVTVGKILLTM